jgi:RimJ/RimL family protein N-acetyltransferase
MANPQNLAAVDSARPYEVKLTEDNKPYIRIASRDQTDAIFLTEFYEEDAEALRDIMNIEAINNALISVPKPYSLDDAKFWVNLQMTSSMSPSLQVIRLEHPKNGKFIGCVTLSPHAALISGRQAQLPSNPDDYELGYYLHPDFQKRGIMGAAVKIALQYGHGERGITSVCVRAVQENLSSCKIIESLPGFEALYGGEAVMVDWPKAKGGDGTRKVLSWRKIMPHDNTTH